MAERRCVVVAGFPRSGTSWLAKVLSFAPGFTYYREPDTSTSLFDSWRRLGWDPRPERLLKNARLVADHLGPFAELIRSATGYWERAGALWAATIYVIHRQTRADGARIIGLPARRGGKASGGLRREVREPPGRFRQGV
jgi:hypothetical protein